MHDLGIFLWIAIVLIGVVSSIAKNARKAQPPSAAPRVPVPRPAPVPAPPPVATLAPPPVATVPPLVAPPPRAVHPPVAEPAARTRGLFADGKSIVRGIIAAEVLGKPKAERLDDSW